MESIVKLEPVEWPEDDNDPPTVVNISAEPEFIQVKTEIEVLPLQESVKTDDEATATKPDNDEEWPVPVTGIRVVPENFLRVQMKIEPADNQNGGENEQPNTSKNSTSTPQNELACPLCNKELSNKSKLNRHIQLHSRPKYTCDVCTKEFLRKDMFERHTIKHTERAYKCDQCDKRFNSPSNLLQHKRVHLTEKPFYCNTCHRTFALKANLAKHQSKSRCKRPIDEPITCHLCNKEFKKEFLLKSHLRRHETAKPFTCDQCNMKFKYKSTLLRHMQLHDGNRPFACPFCDKSFTHSGLLKPHVRVHTGEKPFTCPICEKKFAHKHNMQRHEQRHSKVKRLVCDVCHKKFPKESRLKYHMRVHINEKFFKCHVCPKRFSHRQNVLRHYSRKHPNATYDCTDTDASVSLKVWDAVIKSKYEEHPEEILG